MVADHCSSEPLSSRRQLTQYLEEVVELNKAPENVFKFWKELAILYPELSILAFQVLCVPATSAPVERDFRQSGLLFRPHRARLSSNLLSMLVYLKCNKSSSLIVIFAFSVHCSMKIFRFQIIFLFLIKSRSRHCIFSVSTKRSRSFRVSKT